MHNYLLTGKSHPKANKFEVNKNDHNSRIKSPIKNSYFPRTIKQWNNLPNHIIDIETIEQFNNCILGIDLL